MVKKMAKDGYIPFEIQEKILKRLPVKSLIRFISVSKPWKSLIHSSKFIVDYPVAQPQLLVWYKIAEKKKCVSIADDDIFPRQKLYLTPPAVLNFIKIAIGNSSHGLLCYYIPKKKVVLWNPTIRKTVSINLPVLLDFPYKTHFGFGVCPSTYDPKLVKTTFNSKLKEIHSVEVFTLSSGIWRSPRSNLPRKSIFFSQFNQVYVDGCIYWKAYDFFPLPDGLFWPGVDYVPLPRGSLQPSEMILSFSVTSEEFTEISYPHSFALNDGIRFALFKLRESLVVLEINIPDQVNVVWMMINHGNAKSFTKLFNINLEEASLTQVVGFGNSGEAMVLKDEDVDVNADLFVYEPNSKNVRSLIGITEYSSMTKYTETLLLLDH